MIEDDIVICKKIKYKENSEQKIILGIILRETDKIIIFQTSKRKYVLQKNKIISNENTNEIFECGELE